MPVPNLIDKQFILDRVEIDTVGWCWNWALKLQGSGYARVKEDGKFVSIHRRAYELFSGPIPKGLTLDHLCRNTACCNPDHLEPVTSSENRRRGVHQKPATHCKHGHEYTPENTAIQLSRGRPTKLCRICRAARFKKYRKMDPDRFSHTRKKSRAKNLEKTRAAIRDWYKSDAGVAWGKAYRSTPEYKARARDKAAKRRAAAKWL